MSITHPPLQHTGSVISSRSVVVHFQFIETHPKSDGKPTPSLQRVWVSFLGVSVSVVHFMSIETHPRLMAIPTPAPSPPKGLSAISGRWRHWTKPKGRKQQRLWPHLHCFVEFGACSGNPGNFEPFLTNPRQFLVGQEQCFFFSLRRMLFFFFAREIVC